MLDKKGFVGYVIELNGKYVFSIKTHGQVEMTDNIFSAKNFKSYTKVKRVAISVSPYASIEKLYYI